MGVGVFHSNFWAGSAAVAQVGVVAAGKIEAHGQYRAAAKEYYRGWVIDELHYDTFNMNIQFASGMPLWQWMLLDFNRRTNRYLWGFRLGGYDVAFVVTDGRMPWRIPPRQSTYCVVCGRGGTKSERGYSSPDGYMRPVGVN